MCPVVSWNAVMRMRGLTADSGVDNVLLEWTLMLELATVRPSPRPCRVVPLLFGHVTSAGGCPLTLGDILPDRSPGDATTTLTAAEMVPDVVVTSVVDTVDRFLRSKGLTPSAELRTRSARAVYRDITGYIGVALHSICAKSLPPDGTWSVNLDLLLLRVSCSMLFSRKRPLWYRFLHIHLPSPRRGVWRDG